MVHILENEEGGAAVEVAFVGSGENNLLESYNIRVFNLLQQSNFCNNHSGTSQGSDGKTLLL
jgi:hypothetical protein